MRKQNLLKLVMMVVAMFVFAGAWAQDDPATAGDVHDVNLVTGDPANRDTITVGYTAKYIALPDNTYHSNYNSGGSWALTPNFTWTWTYYESDGTTELTLDTEYEIAAGAERANEVRVTWLAEGEYIITTQEVAPPAWGGCPGTITSLNVAVVPIPIRVTVPSGSYSQCGDLLAQNISVNLTGYPGFDIVWRLDLVNLDENGDEILGTEVNLVDYTDAAPQRLGVNNFSAPVTGQAYTVDALRDFVVVADLSTKYTYTFEGINDLYSRKSDYISGTTSWFPNPTDNQTYVVIVNPAPITGPIYHIPNNWGS